jgi:ceramide glucosyltransferase
MARHVLAALFGLGALCGIGYYLLCLVSARKFLRRSRALPGFAPPVSILKPLRGADPEGYENFRSHCLQDYPEYEIVFGVRDAADAAVPFVERLIQECPDRQIRLVVCPAILGNNQKVGSLIQMLPQARYDYLLIDDSDIRVAPDYLRRVMACFADPKVGMVTCLYRGVAGRTLGSRLEALGINTEFMAGVLAARQLEGGIHFALGSTLAISRSCLQKIGGFEPLVDYLADDFQLGYRTSAAGLDVRLADTVVENFLPDYTFSAFLQHQLRWSRSTRHSRPSGHAGLVLTFGVAWALAALVVSWGAAWAWALLAAAVATRTWLAYAVGRVVLDDRRWARDLWLLPFRDLLALVVWIGSYTGRTVHWRGTDFILEDGKLKLAADS